MQNNKEYIEILQGLKNALEKLKGYLLGLNTLSKEDWHFIRSKKSLPEIEQAFAYIEKLDREEKQQYILGKKL